MNEQKQIEELIDVITCVDDNGYAYDSEGFEITGYANSKNIAEALYNAGYRKQSEGEWIKATEWMREDGEIYDYRCSCCNMLAVDGGYGNRDELTKFCPNCGAKMKGGERYGG